LNNFKLKEFTLNLARRVDVAPVDIPSLAPSGREGAE